MIAKQKTPVEISSQIVENSTLVGTEQYDTRCAICNRFAYQLAGGPLEPEGTITPEGWICAYCLPIGQPINQANHELISFDAIRNPFGPMWTEMPKYLE